VKDEVDREGREEGGGGGGDLRVTGGKRKNGMRHLELSVWGGG